MAIWGKVSNQAGTAIAYGNGLYIISNQNSISGNSEIFSSPDLINWTLRYTGAVGSISAIIWNGSIFVAAGPNEKIITSASGTTWTERISDLDLVKSVIWTGIQFIACGVRLGYASISISTDGGITWVSSSMGYPYGTLCGGIVYDGSGIYVAGLHTGEVASSTDLITWTTRYTGLGFSWGHFAYGNGIFVVTPISSGDQILTSSNGTIWTASLVGITDNTNNKFFNGKFLVTGFIGEIKTSVDGTIWVSDVNLGSSPSDWMNDITWDGTRYVAIGNTGAYRSDFINAQIRNLYYSWSTNPAADISFVSPNRFHVRRGAMFMDNIKKTVYETFPVVFEFDDFILTASENIASYTVTCVNTATGVDTKATMVSSDNNASPKINVIVQAGTAGETHKITVSATTNFGNVYELDCTLDIVETRGYDMFMKQPGEKKTLSNDFTKDLAGDTVASFTITATKISDGTNAAGVLNTSTNGANTVIFGVQAGDDGEFYAIAIKIVSALGYKYQKDLLMNVRAI